MEREQINVLSFGAGVQSTTLLMMSITGELEPLDAVVFADTGWEPREVYEHLAWCKEQCSAAGIEFVQVERASLRDDTLNVIQRRKDGERGGMRATLQLPAFASAEGVAPSLMRRYCTRNYKVDPVRKAITALRKKHGVKHAAVWLGISVDEIQRMKHSTSPTWSYRHPLAWDLRMSRQHCLTWMAQKGFPRPPRSACVTCPFRSNAEWKHLRDNDPDAWADAIATDSALRDMDMRAGYKTWLHRSGLPLGQAPIDGPDGQGSLTFADECAGMCGL